jgi:hypothetical protein
VLVNSDPQENEQPTSCAAPGPSGTSSGGASQTSNPAEEDSNPSSSTPANPASKVELSLGVTIGGLFVTLGAIAGGGLLAF